MAANKTIKETLLEKTAEDLQHPYSVVENVMGWVFKDVLKAFKRHTQIEISGLGYYIISEAKLRRRVETLERVKHLLEAKPQDESTIKKLEGVNKDLEYCHLKTNEIQQKKYKTNMGRVEEQYIATGEIEGGNNEDSGGENGNMQELS